MVVCTRDCTTRSEYPPLKCKVLEETVRPQLGLECGLAIALQAHSLLGLVQAIEMPGDSILQLTERYAALVGAPAGGCDAEKVETRRIISWSGKTY